MSETRKIGDPWLFRLAGDAGMAQLRT